MTAASGVVFTAFRIGPELVKQVTMRVCYCTPGLKPEQMAKDYREITPGLLRDGTTLFGETLEGFLKGWYTEHHHPLAIKREVALWGAFLTSWNGRKMTIQRSLKDPFFCEAKKVGDIRWVSILTQGSFDTCREGFREEKVELERYGFETKKKIAIVVKEKFSPPKLTINCEMQPFSKCLKKHGDAFRECDISTQMLRQFELAFSIPAMQLVSADSPAIQYFSAEESGKTWKAQQR